MAPSEYVPISNDEVPRTTNHFSCARAFPQTPSRDTDSERHPVEPEGSEYGIADECLGLIAAARRAFTAAQTARSHGDEHNARLYLMLAQRRAQCAAQIQREFE